jgi:predicted PolB exonuclease-like 3'-5' exonuclease
MKKTLYIDIETIPGPESGKDSVKVKVPANYKDEAKIAAFIEAGKEEAYRKQSFDGGYGQVCAISYAIDDGPVSGITLRDDRSIEYIIIGDIFGVIEAELDGHSNPYVCGHFVSGFDLRFLMHRCIILGIQVPHWLATTANAAAWSDKLRDTMQIWAGNRGTIGLDELCKILGIEGKGDMDGSMVYDMWLAGEHEKISEYCNQDVERVRAINRKFLEVGI